jgi:hypothetical protein
MPYDLVRHQILGLISHRNERFIENGRAHGVSLRLFVIARRGRVVGRVVGLCSRRVKGNGFKQGKATAR